MSWLQITFGRGRKANKDLGEVKRQRKKERQRIWLGKKGKRRERKRGAL